jgi:hypothetical protein
VTPSGATGLQVVDGLSELATTGVPGTIVQVGKDLSMAVDPDRACRLDQDAVRPSRVQALVVATVDQWAAAVGATDPAAGTAGLARMSLAGSSGSWPGASLDPATLARLMMMPGLRRVLLAGDGRVLNVGCTPRLATPAQRKALAVRDVGCIIPGCGMPTEWSDVHHVVPWSAGGATDLDNLVALCPRHHTDLHAGIWQIVMRDAIPWVRPPAWLDRHRRLIRNTTYETRARARNTAQQLRLALDGQPDR